MDGIARRWRPYSQHEGLGYARPTAVERLDRYAVRSGRMRVCNPYNPRCRIAFQLSFERRRSGNVDARCIRRRRIGRDRPIGAKRNGCFWVIAQNRRHHIQVATIRGRAG